MSRLIFNRSLEPTVGVEVELALVDATTMALRSAKLNGAPQREHFRTDFVGAPIPRPLGPSRFSWRGRAWGLLPASRVTARLS